MLNEDLATTDLSGSYRDVLRDGEGQITWDSGWKKNQIVIDCRRLLAAFMRGQPDNLGIQGIRVGIGDPRWDDTGAPRPQATDTLVDKSAVLVDLSAKVGGTNDPAIKLDYLDPNTGAISVEPTQRLQIVTTIGPGVATGTLREFALVARIGLVGLTRPAPNREILVNLVRHVAIVKDPLSTLVRTIQLVF